jgi:hypothetical protein
VLLLDRPLGGKVEGEVQQEGSNWAEVGARCRPSLEEQLHARVRESRSIEDWRRWEAQLRGMTAVSSGRRRKARLAPTAPAQATSSGRRRNREKRDRERLVVGVQDASTFGAMAKVSQGMLTQRAFNKRCCLGLLS